MRSLFAIAFVTGALVAATASAEPIVVKDTAGKSYQLNDDGTYGELVKSGDGRSFLLAPDGSWGSTDEDENLAQRFLNWIDKARSGGPNLSEADWPKYRQCLAEIFKGMPRTARRTLLSGTDPRDGFGRLEARDPDAARIIDGGDRLCRRNLNDG